MKPTNRLIGLLFALFIVASLSIMGRYNQTSAPVLEAPSPKQSHHVVYFDICGEIVGALLIAEHVVWIPPNGNASDEVLARMYAAIAAERAYTVAQEYRGCLHKKIM